MRRGKEVGLEAEEEVKQFDFQKYFLHFSITISILKTRRKAWRWRKAGRRWEARWRWLLLRVINFKTY